MRLADTLDVDCRTAEAYGLINPDDEGNGARLGAATAALRLPRWRHAADQLSTPAFEQAWSFSTTPGLNAIGHEPELDAQMHAQAPMRGLFLLSADTGVTKSDIEIWRPLHSPRCRAPAGRGLVCSTKIERPVGRAQDSGRNRRRNRQKVAQQR